MGVETRQWPSWRSCAVMPSRTWRSVLAIGFVLMLLLPLYQLRDRRQFLYINKGVYNNTLYHGTESAVHPHFNFSSPCEGFPSMDGIMLVMKTGATEAFDKVPTQLLTSLQCIDDFLLFSDLEQQVGKYHIYNVLDRVEESVKEKYEEFKLYEAQLTCPISQKYCTKDMKGGWELDKFKFLNMVVRTWEMRPGMQWYVFAEADTYVVWKNLVHWLRKRANAKEDPYVGSVAMLGGLPFAHGGSGYVVSGTLLKKMVEEIPNLAAKYDAEAGNECCGDVMFAKAVQEVGFKVKQAHPMFNGEKPNTLPYGPGHWCEPILTMHHMNSEEVSAVWQYEQTRTKKEFMQIKELYHAFFGPSLVSYRKDWDNLSDDTCYISPEDSAQEKANDDLKRRQKKQEEKNVVERSAHTSAAACAKVCEADGLDVPESEFESIETETGRSQLIRSLYQTKVKADEGFKKNRNCFQWRYQKGVCCTAKSFKLGTPRHEKEDADKWTSGWFVRGINDWIDTQGECPVIWRTPH